MKELKKCKKCGLLIEKDKDVCPFCKTNQNIEPVIENNDNTIVKDASSAIKKIFNEGVQMNDEYKKYSGDHVMHELKTLINKL